ncbi:MAG: anaerobic ribonucleoside-triphosphate reductase activating protein [Cardiobacteriaceae bacterium]|nr:anaerobic ribonucleoside-triphosphate reductase activating protein [Cardiobacteriaceae bacterium]
MLRFTTESIVWQEVPGEVSLAFLVSGCPLRCPGCHSAESWRSQLGTPLTPEYLGARLAQYRGLISCVLFMGGEWQADVLLARLQQVRAAGLATCLYTGLEQNALPPQLLPHLDYLKTGRWIAARGGLDSPDTNQRLIDLRSGEILNHFFLQSVTGAMPYDASHRCATR